MKQGIFIITILALLLGACAQTPTGNSVAEETAAQIVSVGVSGPQYTFDKEVEVGKPVRLVFDMDQLQGCSRAVTIPSYGIRKIISQEDNIIEFTPTSSGPLPVACTMNMYTGELMVR